MSLEKLDLAYNRIAENNPAYKSFIIAPFLTNLSESNNDAFNLSLTCKADNNTGKAEK
ncbi:MAG: hypothetical protein K0R98_809 [Rickettsiaceae bacterium]|jgi:hypothetical protein|nr:hypothetical protein [Rickettsiaceae bacterium]